MGLTALFFYGFAVLLILAGLMVISARNPVHAVLFLIFAFFNAAGLFVTPPPQLHDHRQPGPFEPAALSS